MKNLLIIIALIFLNQPQARTQTGLPQKIKISLGNCNATCGYTHGFNDIHFQNELEYDLRDSTFRYRKKPHKPFKKLDAKPGEIFTNLDIYSKLDSLYENFTEFKSSRGKYYIYKIELIYVSDGNKLGLPLKIKTMEFVTTKGRDSINPEFIELLLREYSRVYWSR